MITQSDCLCKKKIAVYEAKIHKIIQTDKTAPKAPNT
jgi:hypothetical protein